MQVDLQPAMVSQPGFIVGRQVHVPFSGLFTVAAVGLHYVKQRVTSTVTLSQGFYAARKFRRA